MRKVLPAVAGLALIMVALAACGPSEQEVAAEARAEEWAKVQDAQAALQALREEAKALRDRIAQGAEALELDEADSRRFSKNWPPRKKKSTARRTISQEPWCSSSTAVSTRI